MTLVGVAVKTMPAWTVVGVPEPTGTSNWYQREPVRVLLPTTPVLSTAMFCEVQSWWLRMWAWNSRSSSASTRPFCPPVLPRCWAWKGAEVVGTVIGMFAEIPGVPPGSEIRYMSSVP